VAKAQEARGWFLYAVAVGIAFLVLAFRLYYAGGATSPFLILGFIDVPFVIAVPAGALAALGLHQALWSSLVKPHGQVLYVASFLMFVVGLLLFYALPDHLSQRDVFLLQFVSAFLVFVYTPSLSWVSKPLVGIGVGGGAALLVLSLYGVMLHSIPILDQFQRQPLVAATLLAEGLLLVTLLRFGQISFMAKAAAA